MADYEVLDEKVTHRLAQRRDSGIHVSGARLTQLGQAAIALLEPIHDVQFASIRASRLKAMDETPIMAGPSGGTRWLMRLRMQGKQVGCNAITVRLSPSRIKISNGHFVPLCSAK